MKEKYPYDCFVVSSHTWITKAYYSYYFHYLLSSCFKGSCYEYISDRTAISSSFYINYKQLSSCWSVEFECAFYCAPHPLINQAPTTWDLLIPNCPALTYDLQLPTYHHQVYKPGILSVATIRPSQLSLLLCRLYHNDIPNIIYRHLITTTHVTTIHNYYRVWTREKAITGIALWVITNNLLVQITLLKHYMYMYFPLDYNCMSTHTLCTCTMYIHIYCIFALYMYHTCYIHVHVQL